MATISLSRAYALGASDNGSGPRKLSFPATNAQAFTPGAYSEFASGLIQCRTAVTTTGLIGIAEESLTTGQVTTGTTLVQHTLILPGFIYEASLVGAVGADRTLVGGTKRSSSMTNSYFGVSTGATAAAGPHLILGMASDLGGVFTTNNFVAQNATAVTAGAVNRPYSTTKGGLNDTNVRVWFTFIPAACVLAS